MAVQQHPVQLVSFSNFWTCMYFFHFVKNQMETSIFRPQVGVAADRIRSGSHKSHLDPIRFTWGSIKVCRINLGSIPTKKSRIHFRIQIQQLSRFGLSKIYFLLQNIWIYIKNQRKPTNIFLLLYCFISTISPILDMIQ